MPTLVEIRNFQGGGDRCRRTSSSRARSPPPHNGEDTDVTIENPIGTTIVDNQRGNIIVSLERARSPFLLLRTNVLRLNADTNTVPATTNGSIGSHVTTGGVITSRTPVPVELVQFVNETASSSRSS